MRREETHSCSAFFLQKGNQSPVSKIFFSDAIITNNLNCEPCCASAGGWRVAVHGLKFMQLSLLCRVTCAVTGCKIDVREHHFTRVITLLGFLQSARPPSSRSRTCRRLRMARFCAFCALDNLCNLCTGLAEHLRIIESVDHSPDQSVPY
jgi:hypothetical protein